MMHYPIVASCSSSPLPLPASAASSSVSGSFLQYPSIMMAHNLCYTTLISAQDARNMPADSYSRTPNGDYFVTAKERKGT